MIDHGYDSKHNRKTRIDYKFKIYNRVVASFDDLSGFTPLILSLKNENISVLDRIKFVPIALTHLTQWGLGPLLLKRFNFNLNMDR